MKTGVQFLEDGICRFTVWAPFVEEVGLHLLKPQEQLIMMEKKDKCFYSIDLKDIPDGTLYLYQLNGKELPDPASHFQPQGVHGPSAVVNHGNFDWKENDWKGLPLRDLIFYELHVGSFTDEGTFEAVIDRLDDLAEIGINAIELMPVSQFPGTRNWGYDGVFPYSVQHSYGGPNGLKSLVRACHQNKMCIFLDMVYNHLGPEGNYFDHYGPYFTDRYTTPWGDAINFDGELSDPVREYFANNAIHWIENYHLDGLRLDAVHEVYDRGAVPFWQFTSQKIQALTKDTGKKFHLIAESDFNSPNVVKPTEAEGLGFDAQWLDDFHHALYVLLDREGLKFYEDFGRIEQYVKANKDGFVHSGDYVKARK